MAGDNRDYGMDANQSSSLENVLDNADIVTFRSNLETDNSTRQRLLSHSLSSISPTDNSLREPLPRDNSLREPLLQDNSLREPLPRDNSLREPLQRDNSLREPLPRENSLREPLPPDQPVREALSRSSSTQSLNNAASSLPAMFYPWVNTLIHMVDRSPAFQLQPPQENTHPFENHEPQEAVPEISLKSLQESIISSLECRVCLNIMVPPIYHCENGHDVCSDCRKCVNICPTCDAEYTTARNFVIEEMVMNLFCHCKFQDVGCKAVMIKGKIAEHESTCVYGTCGCFHYSGGSKACFWHGLKADLYNHVKLFHGCVVEGNEDRSFHLIPAHTNMEKECLLMIAFGEMFWLHTKYDPNVGLFKAVQYIGPPENAHFKYCFGFSHPSHFPLRQYTDCVFTLNENFDMLCEEEDCFFISQKSYRKMIFNRLVRYQFEIEKIE